jgi:hypothetical protein
VLELRCSARPFGKKRRCISSGPISSLAWDPGADPLRKRCELGLTRPRDDVGHVDRPCYKSDLGRLLRLCAYIHCHFPSRLARCRLEPASPIQRRKLQLPTEARRMSVSCGGSNVDPVTFGSELERDAGDKSYVFVVPAGIAGLSALRLYSRNEGIGPPYLGIADGGMLRRRVR